MMGGVAGGGAMKTPEELLHENLRLVNFVLRRYFPTLAQDEDLAQEGSIGLWKACMSYDGRGKFSTFAVLCIKCEILMCLRKRRRSAGTVSLDAPFGDDTNSTTLGDMVEDPKASTFEAEAETNDFIRRLRDRDRRIIELRVAGLTQKDIAQSTGISQVGVSRRLCKVGALYRKMV